YPWELLHDGKEFLCLKHFVGRYVNALPLQASKMREETSPSEFERINVLLISVPNPRQNNYQSLPGAVAETKALINALSKLGNVNLQVLARNSGTEPTLYNVRKALTSGS